jgi:hypothetical protein
MNSKIYNFTIIFGISVSFLINGYSNYFISIDRIPDLNLNEVLGNPLFQISHIILFTRSILKNNGYRFNQILLIPIVLLLIDLIPLELFHSLKLGLLSTFSIILGWGVLSVQKKSFGIIGIGVICLIVSMIPGITTISSIDNLNGTFYQFGLKVYGFDNFTISNSTIGFSQSFSLLIYSISTIKFVLGNLK